MNVSRSVADNAVSKHRSLSCKRQRLIKAIGPLFNLVPVFSSNDIRFVSSALPISKSFTQQDSNSSNMAFYYRRSTHIPVVAFRFDRLISQSSPDCHAFSSLSALKHQRIRIFFVLSQAPRNCSSLFYKKRVSCSG